MKTKFNDFLNESSKIDDLIPSSVWEIGTDGAKEWETVPYVDEGDVGSAHKPEFIIEEVNPPIVTYKMKFVGNKHPNKIYQDDIKRFLAHARPKI